MHARDEAACLPDLSWTDDTAWMRAIDLKLQDVPELDISKFIKKSYERPAEKPNMQTPEVFESERFRIDKAFRLSAGFAPATATGTLFNPKPRLLSRGSKVHVGGRN